MQLISSTLILGASFLAVVIPTVHADCLVNAQIIDSWGEDGQTRYRTAFSSSGVDTGGFCSIWYDNDNSAGNEQCYYNDVVGSWVADGNWVVGPAGADAAEQARSDSLRKWQEVTGCLTG